MKKHTKRAYALILAFVLALASMSPITVSAAYSQDISVADTEIAPLLQTGSRTFSASGSMGLINLPVGQSRTSSVVQFNVSGLPANATIRRITVHPGTSTQMGGVAGVIVGNFMQVATPARTVQIPWNGGTAINAVDSSVLVGLPANGTFLVSWNGTAISGSLPTLLQPSNNMATRGFSNVRLTVDWEVR